MTTSLLQVIGAFLQLALLLGKILQQRQLLAEDHANELNAILAESQRILAKVKAARAAVRGIPGDEFDMDGPHSTIVDDGASSGSPSDNHLSKLLSGEISQPDGQPGHSETATEK